MPKMSINDSGLVLREVKLRESDRILTLLTARHGVVSVSSRGSMRPNSKLFSASGMFSYSNWTLREGKDMYSAVEASPVEVFFGIRERVEALALAAYIADILQILSPSGQEGESLLRLALNSLYVLCKNACPPELVKTVFELRALAESGFMPDVAACGQCGARGEGGCYFDVHGGDLLCEACAEEAGIPPNLSPAALAALRHIVLCPPASIYRFSLQGDSMRALGMAAESFLLYQMDYPPKTLAFLKTVL